MRKKRFKAKKIENHHETKLKLLKRSTIKKGRLEEPLLRKLDWSGICLKIRKELNRSKTDQTSQKTEKTDRFTRLVDSEK